jgi:GNAT superfamily N-acetyltransferase
VTDRLLLERLAADAWPALETVEVDGWRLRASCGVTRRANSALPLSDALPVDEVVAFYRARSMSPVVQVSDERTDAALAARGWQRDMDVDVMVGQVSPGRSSALVASEPDPAWVDCWWEVDGRGGPAELDVACRMLRRIEAPAAYVSVVRAGRTVAVGRGVAQEGHLGVFSMAVRPELRRQGLAREVLRALGEWGRQHDAETAYLQVFDGNLAARALYAGEGFGTSHRYHYRLLP